MSNTTRLGTMVHTIANELANHFGKKLGREVIDDITRNLTLEMCQGQTAWAFSGKPSPDGDGQPERQDNPSPKGSGSIEFDRLLADFHAAVWAAAADEESRTDYDLAGIDIAKKIQAMFRANPGANPAPPENFSYRSTQATGCAGCGKYKHTPLRVDAMGGYVCLTCIYNELDRLLIEESARHAEPDWEGAREISDLPHIHDMLGDFSADPTEDNAISVVQAIVMATTRKPAQ